MVSWDHLSPSPSVPPSKPLVKMTVLGRGYVVGMGYVTVKKGGWERIVGIMHSKLYLLHWGGDGGGEGRGDGVGGTGGVVLC